MSNYASPFLQPPTSATFRSDEQPWLGVGALKEKLAAWIFFGVIPATAPVLATMLFLATRDQSSSVAMSVTSPADLSIFEEALARGELLIVAAAIGSASLGEMILAPASTQSTYRIAAMGGSFLVVFFSALWFGSVASTLIDGGAVNELTVVYGSLGMFIASLVCAGGCTALSAIAP